MRQIFRVILTMMCLSLVAEARIWTNLTGKQLEAEYVSLSLDRVTLKSPQGEVFSVLLDKLSPEDQEYVRNQARPSLPSEKAVFSSAAVPDVGNAGVLAQMIPGKTFTRTAAGETAIKYHVRVPPSFDSSHPPPLVIAFSPKGNGRFMVEAIGTSADKAGWIAVGCDKLKNGMPDAKLVEKMEDEVLDDIFGNIPHDPRRIYLAGHSGGAMRVYRISARRKEPFAGILAYSGWMGGEDKQKQPFCQNMAVAMVNGDQDSAVKSWEQRDTQALVNRKCRVKLFGHPGGHAMQVPPEITDQCIQWFQEDWKIHGTKSR